MALVTICKYRRAKTPYFLEQAGLNMYSLEELAWFLYHNICLAEPQMFDDRLCRWLEEEGDLLLSGIIDERGDEVLEAYEKEGMLVKNRKSREGWTMLHLGKKV